MRNSLEKQVQRSDYRPAGFPLNPDETCATSKHTTKIEKPMLKSGISLQSSLDIEFSAIIKGCDLL